MSLEKEKFRSYTLDEDKKGGSKPIPVRLNEDERLLLDKCKNILEQPKDSTALKSLAWIGAKVIHEEKTAYLLETIFSNKRKNKRTGLNEFE